MSILLLKKILLPGMELIKENIGYLTELDSLIGDGDHGVTMGKVANLITDTIEKAEDTASPEDLLDDLSWDLMNINGGSAGPLWGAFFEGMGIGAGKGYKTDSEFIKSMMIEGYNNFFEISKAKPGQKTMMDAIFPATQIARKSTDSVERMTEQMAEAATKGAEATSEMIAYFGRAKSLKEKSIGYKDPGAVSFSLFYQGIAKGFNV